MNNTIARVGESVSLIALIILLILFLNPFDIWMPSMMHTTLVGVIAALFLVLLLFMFGQEAKDERDMMHRMFSDRLALLAGVSVLMIALICTAITDQVKESPVVIALGVIALTKYVALQYARRYK